eukprot:1374102-Pyramimonas_sp.AAC.1
MALFAPPKSRGDPQYMSIRSSGVPALPSPVPARIRRQRPCLFSCGVSAAAGPTAVSGELIS